MSGFSLTAMLTAVSLVFTGISASAADGDLPPELQGLGLYEDILPIGSDGIGGLPSSRRASRQQSIIPFIISSLPKATSAAATNNIANAEQVTMLPKSPRILPATHWTTLPLPAIAANWI